MKYLLIALLFIISCNQDPEKIHYPSAVYHYVKMDTTGLQSRMYYVPVYSHIYSQSGNRVLNLTATVSIRNTSFKNSFYISRADYYGSQGQVIKKYLDSAILVKPMSSIEFVVEEKESEGGAGANFVVQQYSNNGTNPFIEAVMTGTNTGVSFTSSAVEIHE